MSRNHELAEAEASLREALLLHKLDTAQRMLAFFRIVEDEMRSFASENEILAKETIRVSRALQDAVSTGTTDTLDLPVFGGNPLLYGTTEQFAAGLLGAMLTDRTQKPRKIEHYSRPIGAENISHSVEAIPTAIPNVYLLVTKDAARSRGLPRGGYRSPGSVSYRFVGVTNLAQASK